jgi:hypothetical protein
MLPKDRVLGLIDASPLRTTFLRNKLANSKLDPDYRIKHSPRLHHSERGYLSSIKPCPSGSPRSRITLQLSAVHRDGAVCPQISAYNFIRSPLFSLPYIWSTTPTSAQTTSNLGEQDSAIGQERFAWYPPPQIQLLLYARETHQAANSCFQPLHFPTPPRIASTSALLNLNTVIMEVRTSNF